MLARARLVLARPGDYADSMKRLEIDLSDETFVRLTENPVSWGPNCALPLPRSCTSWGRVSQEVASQIAGVSRSEFLTVVSQLEGSPMQESAGEALAGADVLLQL